MKSKKKIILATLFIIILAGCAGKDNKGQKSQLNIINTTDYQIIRAYIKENIRVDQYIILPDSQIKAGQEKSFIIEPGKWIIAVVFSVNDEEVTVDYQAVFMRGIEYKWELTQEKVYLPAGITGKEISKEPQEEPVE